MGFWLSKHGEQNKMSQSVLHEAVEAVQAFFESWGWIIVFTIVALYILKPYILQAVEKRKLQLANDPQRVAVLNEDMKKARLRQNLDNYKINRESKAEQGESIYFGKQKQ